MSEQYGFDDLVSVVGNVNHTGNVVTCMDAKNSHVLMWKNATGNMKRIFSKSSYGSPVKKFEMSLKENHPSVIKKVTEVSDVHGVQSEVLGIDVRDCGISSSKHKPRQTNVRPDKCQAFR